MDTHTYIHTHGHKYARTHTDTQTTEHVNSLLDERQMTQHIKMRTSTTMTITAATITPTMIPVGELDTEVDVGVSWVDMLTDVALFPSSGAPFCATTVNVY